MKVLDVLIEKITVVENIRGEFKDSELSGLMESIKQNGLKEPIGVGITLKEDYVLMYGFRRLMAYKKLGYKTIPCVIVDEPEIQELLLVNTIENIQRKDILPAELGRICVQLLELELTIGEIAVRLSVPESRIINALEIYGKLSKEVAADVEYMTEGKRRKKGKISPSAALGILHMKKKGGLKESDVAQLLGIVKRREMTITELGIIGSLIQLGMTVEGALKEKNLYTVVHVKCVVDVNTLNIRRNKYKITSGEILREVIYGEIAGFKRPVCAIYRNRKNKK